MSVFNKLFKKNSKAKIQSIEVKLSDGMLSIGNAQHCGKRDYQEDSFGFSDISEEKVNEKGVMAVLADGMGGLKNGKAVSETVVGSVLGWFDENTGGFPTGENLKGVTAEINKRICETYCKGGSVEAGSTVVEVVIKDGYMHWLSVGDSRIYIKRETGLHQINEDHDYLNQLLQDAIDSGDNVNDAFNDPQKDSLAECIGKEIIEKYDYSKTAYKLSKGDIVVLCSDGVYNALSSEEMNRIISDNAMESCGNIIDSVARKGIPGQDNNTIIVMSYR